MPVMPAMLTCRNKNGEELYSVISTDLHDLSWLV